MRRFDPDTHDPAYDLTPRQRLAIGLTWVVVVAAIVWSLYAMGGVG